MYFCLKNIFIHMTSIKVKQPPTLKTQTNLNRYSGALKTPQQEQWGPKENANAKVGQ